MDDISIPVKLNITLDTEKLSPQLQQVFKESSEEISKDIADKTTVIAKNQIASTLKNVISFESITSATDVIVKSIDALTDSLKNLSTTLPSFGSSFASTFSLTKTLESLIKPISSPISKSLSSLFNKTISFKKKDNNDNNNQEVTDDEKNASNEASISNFFNKSISFISSTVSSIGKSIVSLFSSFLSNMESTIKNMASSYYLTNSTTRYNAFTYGMSSSESYGFEVAKSILGISSNEDLLYMSSDQISMFKEIMNKMTAYYDEISESGLFEDYYEMQTEYTLLSYEISLEFLSFFSEYSDTIVELVTAVIEFCESALPIINDILSLLTPVLDVISSFISWLTDLFDDTSTDVSSIIESYQSSSTIVNITSTNNFSGSTSSEIEDYEDATEAMIEAAKLAFTS